MLLSSDNCPDYVWQLSVFIPDCSPNLCAKYRNSLKFVLRASLLLFLQGNACTKYRNESEFVLRANVCRCIHLHIYVEHICGCTCDVYRYMYWREGSGDVAPPPENTQSGGYRSSAAGSSPEGLSSRLTVALVRRISVASSASVKQDLLNSVGTTAKRNSHSNDMSGCYTLGLETDEGA